MFMTKIVKQHAKKELRFYFIRSLYSIHIDALSQKLSVAPHKTEPATVGEDVSVFLVRYANVPNTHIIINDRIENYGSYIVFISK